MLNAECLIFIAFTALRKAFLIEELPFYSDSEENESIRIASMVPSQVQKSKNASPRLPMSAAYELTQGENTKTSDEDFVFLETIKDTDTVSNDGDFVIIEPSKDAVTQTTYGYFTVFEPCQDVGTQTAGGDFILIEPCQDVGTQIARGDFILIESTRDAITQVSDEDFILLKPNRESGTQTANDFIIFETFRDTSTLAIDEDFMLLEPTKDAGTLTTEGDFIFHQSVPNTRDRVADKRMFHEPTQDVGTVGIVEAFSLLEPMESNKTQFSKGNLDFFKKIKSIENNSVSQAETSSDVNEKMFSEQQENNVTNSELSNGSSSPCMPYEIYLANRPRNQNPKDIKTAKTTHLLSMDRYLSNSQIIGDNCLFHESSRYESCDQDSSSNSSQNDICTDFALGENVSTNSMTSNFSILSSVYHESPDSLYDNHAMQTLYYSDEHELEDIEQNNASKFSISQYSQKLFDTSTLSSSGIYENNYKPYMDKENFNPEISLEWESVVTKKELNCLICRRKIAENGTEKVFYNCWLCRYKSTMKIYPHPLACNHDPEQISSKIYGEGFKEKDSPYNQSTYQHQCDAMLKQHFIAHDYSSNCRICKKKIKEHIIDYEERKLYKCCECSYKSHHKKYLQQHLNIHTGLRLFMCNACWKRFPRKKDLEQY